MWSDVSLVRPLRQVERKRHIGNDIVTIVFQEGDDASSSFKPSMIRSHFTRILRSRGDLSEKWSGRQRRVQGGFCYSADITEDTWLDFCACYVIRVSYTSPADIFALVRYNSQNDSYRWVLWLTPGFLTGRCFLISRRKTIPLYCFLWLKRAAVFTSLCRGMRSTLFVGKREMLHVCSLSQVEDFLGGERSAVWTPSPISACIYWSPRIQGLFISQM